MTPEEADELQRLYRKKRFAWARLPCEHFEAVPITKHRGQKPDPNALDLEAEDEG